MQKTTFEKQLEELETIVEKLDAGDAPLEELLKDFETGMTLSASLREFLEKAELKIVEITKKTNTENDSIGDELE